MRSRRCTRLRSSSRSIPISSTISASPALEAGHIPDAIAALQRAVASNPRYADAYFRLGIAWEKVGNIGGALSAYDHATKCSHP